MQSFPDWTNFTPQFVCDRLPKLLAQARASLGDIEKSSPSTFEELVWKLDDATRELMHTWGMLSHIASVMNTPRWRETQERFQPEIVAFSLSVGQSKELYNAAKAILARGESDAADAAVPKPKSIIAQSASVMRFFMNFVLFIVFPF
jgi:oligopeptidase A